MKYARIRTKRHSGLLAAATVLSMVLSLAQPAFVLAANTPLFTDGFESTGTWVTTVATKWNIGGSSITAHSGSKRAVVNGNTTDGQEDKGQISNSLSTAGYEDIQLGFWYKIPVDKGLEEEDYVRVEWSTDNSNFSELTRYTDGDETDDWTFDQLNLPIEAADQTNIYIRFSAVLDAGNDEFYLDDVSITGVGSTPTNSAPVALDQNLSVDEDTALSVTLTATDEDGDNLAYTVVAGPTEGTLSGEAPNLTYTPAARFSGQDSLTFKANDGEEDSNVATVLITVNAVNDKPVALEDSYSTGEDTELTVSTSEGVLKNDTDEENAELTAELTSDVSNGTLTLNSDGSFTYVPNEDFNGEDTFSYKAGDGEALSEEAAVTILVSDENDVPQATADTYSVDEDETLTVEASGVLSNDDDNDGDSLTAILVDGPAHGEVSLDNGGGFSYTPDADFNGTDSFAYKANDGEANSSAATVAITVNPVNDAPAISASPVVTEANTDANGSVTASDIDGDPLAFNLATAPSNGNVSLDSDGSFTYSPDADFTGSDSFEIEVTDGALTASVTVTVTVNAQAVENTEELCTDEIDNDNDGQTDAADADCAPFNQDDDKDPVLTVYTQVINNDGGTATSSDFSITVSYGEVQDVSAGSADGYELGLAGFYQVTGEATSTYNIAYSGACSGTLSEDASCTVTYDDKGEADSEETATTTISGFVWYDFSIDGIWDQIESGLGGHLVYLYDEEGGDPVATTTTESDGLFRFIVDAGKSYSLSYLPNGNWTNSTDNNSYFEVETATGTVAATSTEDAPLNFGIFSFWEVLGLKVAPLNGDASSTPSMLVWANTNPEGEIELETADGEAHIEIATSTVVSSDENFDVLSFGTSILATSTVDWSDASTTPAAALAWGIPGIELEFSLPIDITLFVDKALSGKTLDLFRTTDGSTWTNDGINRTSCTVTADDYHGYCAFLATKASTYVAAQNVNVDTNTETPTEEEENDDDDNGGSGGSGGGRNDDDDDNESSTGTTTPATGGSSTTTDPIVGEEAVIFPAVLSAIPAEISAFDGIAPADGATTTAEAEDASTTAEAVLAADGSLDQVAGLGALDFLKSWWWLLVLVAIIGLTYYGYRWWEEREIKQPFQK